MLVNLAPNEYEGNHRLSGTDMRTAIYNTTTKVRLTPVLHVISTDTAEPHFLRTNETFELAKEAEPYGVLLTREWIDKNVK